MKHKIHREQKHTKHKRCGGSGRVQRGDVHTRNLLLLHLKHKTQNARYKIQNMKTKCIQNTNGVVGQVVSKVGCSLHTPNLLFLHSIHKTQHMKQKIQNKTVQARDKTRNPKF